LLGVVLGGDFFVLFLPVFFFLVAFLAGEAGEAEDDLDAGEAGEIDDRRVGGMPDVVEDSWVKRSVTRQRQERQSGKRQERRAGKRQERQERS
jgi:hypothetical protein